MPAFPSILYQSHDPQKVEKVVLLNHIKNYQNIGPKKSITKVERNIISHKLRAVETLSLHRYTNGMNQKVHKKTIIYIIIQYMGKQLFRQFFLTKLSYNWPTIWNTDLNSMLVRNALAILVSNRTTTKTNRLKTQGC